MAAEHKGFSISLKAAADMKGKRYYPVKVSGDHQFAACVANDIPIGWLQNEVVAGEAGEVMTCGITFAKAAAAIAAGASVMVSDNGTVATATTGKNVCGFALDAATAAGDVISVYIKSNAPTVA
jgi:predicted RecA/RadA family phage recombinase